MQRKILIMTTCCLLAMSAGAENLTQANVEKAQAIIDAAVEAHGGAERLADLKTILIEHKTIGTAVGQSLKPEPPWDRNQNAGISAVDLENDIFVTNTSGYGGGFEFDNGTIINGEQSFQLDFRAGTASPVAEPDFDTSSGPFMRVTPALLVRQASERAHTAHFLGETEFNGTKHAVVAFSMEVGPAISLYFDSKTHRLTHSERILPNFGLVEYGFLDYEVIDGVAFNRQFELHLNGDLNMQRSNLKTAVDVPLGEYTVVSDKLERIAATEPDPLTRQEIADGVFLIGGNGTYAMFVEMDDHIVAVGGTAGMPDRIAQLHEVVTDKPIRYGVLTHHHFDHIVAVPTYAEHGATVVAAAAHAKVVSEAAGEGVELTLETVDKSKTLSDGKRRIEIIDVGPTAHTEHLLVAWLPKEKILFEADHFGVPRNGPVPPAVESTRSFAKALRTHEIEPAMFVSAHSPKTGTMADLKAALNKTAAKVEKTAAAVR